MRVKMCGIRARSDLETAVAAGADAVGFLVGLTHVSEDKLDPVDARTLIRCVPPFVQAILVTHLGDPRAIVDLAGFVGASVIQLHGEMEPGAVARVRDLLPLATLVRAVHVVSGATADEVSAQVARLVPVIDAVLLDSRTVDRLGGTGKTHDWSVSQQVVRSSEVPVILAGGLTPTNVGDAVRAVRPFAVDVNSGVETAAGDKAPDLCAAFVSAALAAA